MALAGTGCQAANRATLDAAVFAGILRFLAAFVKSVFSTTWAIWMPQARTSSKAIDGRAFASAVFTEIIGHGLFLLG